MAIALKPEAIKGQLFILSGPSGSGKTTLCQGILREIAGLEFSISYTTRAPRDNEQHGMDYFFISVEEFERMRSDHVFLEWAEVHGNYYGTSEEYVDRLMRLGHDLLLDIDVQGARQVRRRIPEAISILVFPPSFEELRNRLHSRGKDSMEVIAQRLQVAQSELRHFPDYDYLVINKDLDRALQELRSILQACRCRTGRRTAWAEAILKGLTEE